MGVAEASIIVGQVFSTTTAEVVQVVAALDQDRPPVRVAAMVVPVLGMGRVVVELPVRKLAVKTVAAGAMVSSSSMQHLAPLQVVDDSCRSQCSSTLATVFNTALLLFLLCFLRICQWPGDPASCLASATALRWSRHPPLQCMRGPAAAPCSKQPAPPT